MALEISVSRQGEGWGEREREYSNHKKLHFKAESHFGFNIYLPDTKKLRT